MHLSFTRYFAALAVALVPAFASAQGVLEIPGPGTYQSGVSLISGWHCTAQRVEFSIDGGPRIVAGTRTSRSDTLSTCGRSDTGFSATFAWSLLPGSITGGPTPHRIVAFADGVPFAQAAFSASRFTEEYLVGKTGHYELRNFPDPGHKTGIQWDEEKQNFTIVITPSILMPVSEAKAGSATYYGAMNRAVGFLKPEYCGDPGPPNVVLHGTFTVDTSDGMIGMLARFTDGSVCELPRVPRSPGTGSGFVSAQYKGAAVALCPAFAGGLQLSVDGVRLNARSLESCSTGRMAGAIFSFD
jgi:hypothetical protein